MASLRRDIGSEILFVDAAPKATATAGGAGDATLVHGTAIDLTTLPPPGGGDGGVAIGPCRYESVAFALVATATLADAKGLNVTASIETSAASNFGSATTLVGSKTVLALLSSGGTTEKGVGKISCSLENALQYIRVSFTPDLTATGTDVSDIQAVAAFGGPQELP